MGCTSDKLDSVLKQLYQRRTHGIKLGLDRMTAVLAAMDDPQKEFAVVHVAGTNGKGSVATMAESILRQVIGDTGIYTSPHLVCLNERIRVGGNEVTDEELMLLIDCVEEAALSVAAQYDQATFFEVVTAAAFEHFRRKGSRLAVLETGMGGRLDATNVANPVMTVITSISIDHTEYLGDTIEAIAGEKAGIIKPGIPVVCIESSDEAMDVILRTADSNSAPVIRAAEFCSIERISQSLSGQKIRIATESGEAAAVTLPLNGIHQLSNCAAAVTAASLTAERIGIPLPADAIKQGLESVSWPARLQLLNDAPPVILDGAHNPSAGRVLSQTLRKLLDGRPLCVVLAMMDDKDCDGFLRELGDLPSVCWATEAKNERSLKKDEMAAASRRMSWPTTAASLPDAIRGAMAWAQAEKGVVCITGSLYLAGDVLSKYMKLIKEPN